ncbi:MAG: hypothetical protein LBL16_04745 [Endomicrobium sp.]|jgi:hypothetical protein|nr:hypothetical protein [Endomicrobium sp.]
MEFFASNYTYINFLSAWAYLLLSLACVVSQRSKISKISYTWLWFVVFAICQAIVKFIDTFLCGKDISLNNFAYITHASFIYISYISLLIGSVSAYSKFARIKFLKYYIVSLIIIPLCGYCFLGEVGFESLMFLCFFITSSIFVLLTEYRYYNLIYDDKIKLAVIIVFSQVLSRNKNLDEETEKGIKNIYDAALRSQKIIKNMLEFSRTDILKFQKIDLNNVIESTLLIIEKDLN